MRRFVVLLTFAVLLDTTFAGAQAADVPRWEAQARRATIIRDDWGIPHIYGKKDGDVVFFRSGL